MIKGPDGHTAVTRPLLSWEDFLEGRFSNDDYGFGILPLLPDDLGDLEIKVALNRIN